MSIVGKLLYQYYFRPFVQPVLRLKEDGWFIGRKKIKKGFQEMKMNASSLIVECACREQSPYPPVHFLTGKKYWYQTIHCIYSLLKNISIPIHIIIHDDGTFDTLLIAQIKSQVKNCSIDVFKESTRRVLNTLDKSKYPYLINNREKLPLLYKLLDCHIGYPGYNLLLDSDMLFFHPPKEIEDWLKNPKETIYMQDKYNSYFYSFQLLNETIKKPIRQFVNSGIIGLNNDLINWEEVEIWMKNLIDNQGLNYFIEQVIHALIITKYGGKNLSPIEYTIIPELKEVLECKAHLHHYPTGYRQNYFRTTWRKFKC